MNGWTGKLLRINLTRREHAEEPLNTDTIKAYLGGRGLAVKMFSDEVNPATDALSEDNKIFLITGAVTGTGIPCSSGASAVTKSPRHNGMAISNLTGAFGLELKQAGYDGLIIEGKASEPVYLEIIDSAVSILPATNLKGKTTWQTEAALRKQFKNDWKADEASFITIGPAGENLSPLASAVHNRFREFGQGGLGAVMGSKNLKAMVVWGSQDIGIADRKKLRYSAQTALEKYKTLPVIPGMLRNLGTAAMVRMAHALGALPVNNFSASVLKGAEQIFSEALAGTVCKKPKACQSCPIACTRLSQSPGTKNEVVEGPEYETLVFLGSLLGITDIETILDLMCECLKLGLFIPAAGAALSTGMELNGKGAGADIVPSNLKFGRKQLKPLLKEMALMGDKASAVAQGGFEAARQAGHPQCYAAGYRNCETLMADPRAIAGLGLFGATAHNGVEYLSCFILAALAYGITEGLDMGRAESRALFAKRIQDMTALAEAAGICPLLLLGIQTEDIKEMIEAATGETFPAADLTATGERIWNIERQYQLQCGWNPADDQIAERFTGGTALDMTADRALYFELRGWDADGLQQEEKLKTLGISSQQRTGD